MTMFRVWKTVRLTTEVEAESTEDAKEIVLGIPDEEFPDVELIDCGANVLR